MEREQASLAAASKALTKWRQEFGGRGRAIPEALWGRATEVARAVGVQEAARALKLDAGRLSARVASASDEAEAPGTFVEVAAFPVDLPPAPPTVIELIGCDGERVRVELGAGASSAEVVELARAFWGRGA